MTQEVERLREALEFLSERIEELDWSAGWDNFAREWNGHVEPALARARAAISRTDTNDLRETLEKNHDALKMIVDRIREGRPIRNTSPLLRIACEALLGTRAALARTDTNPERSVSDEQRAREMLAEEYESTPDLYGYAGPIRRGQAGLIAPAIRAISAALQSSAAEQWRLIESAPRDGTRILGWGYLHDDGGPYHEDLSSFMGEMPQLLLVAWDNEFGCWRNRQSGGSYDGLTHWRPLPTPPSEPIASPRGGDV